jgi:hypothetical protein
MRSCPRVHRALLTFTFLLGALLGLPIGLLVIFPISLVRAARAVHASGTLYRATVTSTAYPALAGPALVRLSGAFTPATSTSHDILGLAIRFQRAASDDPSVGDQDLLLGTFTSFSSARASLRTTDATDFLANAYSSVTPWTAPDGVVTTFTIPATAPSPPSPAATDRIARLDADIAGGRATLTLHGPDPIATIQLIARVAVSDITFRESMFRTGRGVRPLGVRNGLRATIYPLSQLARRLRGG